MTPRQRFILGLKLATKPGMHRCEACGLVNDHRDDCTIHELFDSINSALDGFAAGLAPVALTRAIPGRRSWWHRLMVWWRS